MSIDSLFQGAGLLENEKSALLEQGFNSMAIFRVFTLEDAAEMKISKKKARLSWTFVIFKGHRKNSHHVLSPKASGA